jgi:hypothetical protein
MLVGRVVELAAWIGALFNSYMLPGKTWFLVLLLGGVLGIVLAPVGIAVMLAYVVAAPDGVLYRQMQVPTTMPQPGPLAPTT